MTGYASRRGAGAGASWLWEVRSVNGRGLDIRLRLPEWIEGLEPLVRSALSQRLHRGSVSLSLRVARDEAEGALRINEGALSSALAALAATEAAARAAGTDLSPTSGAELLALRGVLEGAATDEDSGALRDVLTADLPALIDALAAMRAGEGAALARVIGGQIDRIAQLTSQAAELAEGRRDEVARALREALGAIMESAAGADPARLEQELALVYVKTDVIEEVDRLRAHVEAARALMQQAGPVGRKLDFLMQEFNREANTLCSKAQSAELTRVGIDLKSVIDQMREQVQNVE